MVGHDLRNPLQAITSAVYMLKKSEKNADFSSGQFVEMIQIINESVKYANKIVSNL